MRYFYCKYCNLAYVFTGSMVPHTNCRYCRPDWDKSKGFFTEGPIVPSDLNKLVEYFLTVRIQ